MELLYLLCSILYSSLTSFVLSLLLPFRFLLHRLFPSRFPVDPNVSFYQGTVWHDRLRPVRHSFRYSVRYALFDLDEATTTPSDHLSADEARRVSLTTGPIYLLTIPPSVGYEQNPLSLYYCYDLDGSSKRLTKCIAQVTNTPWGERVTFVFEPESDLVAKSLQVSPFMDMLGNWKIRANEPGEELSVSIESKHPHLGNYFSATLKAKRIPTTLVSDPAVFFWLMPHKVAIWIYWHALKLWWKNVPFIQHPRYTNPSYREESEKRDQELPCRGLDGLNADACSSSSSFGGCRFAWRDANWPWS
ncbi:PREDICTED: uncharacterized protein LOC104777039 [Camelina sativa]|uniref:Uncharacterized protein LOC104777039 n=1 Tax=Camelina sativa TaxID=90675 RepID=A0ABM0YE00_CAMSA|nr:PREDICTED: uncharacterized protein LOC104777039 [Camelina sativa]XP_010499529.1 PREDICTED: uncharacterized protein LOC104777039 [Camelina sativa]XP_010499530.1 PREDICTED: uncharacterized protein LOC104777039 [Camelina sativa]XP_010499532.1 PREDICTED: uncharacterized protein LOC104777039 [Camelina sativa]